MLLVNQPYVERIWAEVNRRLERVSNEPERLKTDPVLARAWGRMFPQVQSDRALNWAPQSALTHRQPSRLFGASNSGSDLRSGGTRWGSSINWSGATIGARDGQAFRAVMTRFMVPNPLPPPGGVPPSELPRPTNAYSASIWVGLDGHRPASASLPQAGVAIGWVHRDSESHPRPYIYGWAQWWTTDNLDGEVRIEDLEIVAGDTVAIWVSMEEDGAAYFRIFNERSGQDAAARWQPGGEPAPGARAISRRPRVAGSAASWVVERPMALVSQEEFGTVYAFDQRPLLFTLPNFGRVDFRDCAAVMGPPGGTGPSCLRDLTGRRFIGMFRQDQGPYRAVFQSRPELHRAEAASAGDDDAGRFGVRYLAGEDAAATGLPG